MHFYIVCGGGWKTHSFLVESANKQNQHPPVQDVQFLFYWTKELITKIFFQNNWQKPEELLVGWLRASHFFLVILRGGLSYVKSPWVSAEIFRYQSVEPTKISLKVTLKLLMTFLTKRCDNLGFITLCTFHLDNALN